MAARDAAEIFGFVFRVFSEKDKTYQECLEQIWNETKHYDFTDDQMNCDDALEFLGFASRCERCTGLIYKGRKADHECG